MRPLSIGQLAWCAGVFDSMGHLGVRVTDAGADLPMVSLSTSKVEVAERLAAMTGSALVTVRRDYNRVGCSQHCGEPHQHVNSTTVRWSLVGTRAMVFLRGIRPHLQAKGPEVDELLLRSSNPRGKPATVDKMAALGWAVHQ